MTLAANLPTDSWHMTATQDGLMCLLLAGGCPTQTVARGASITSHMAATQRLESCDAASAVRSVCLVRLFRLFVAKAVVESFEACLHIPSSWSPESLLENVPYMSMPWGQGDWKQSWGSREVQPLGLPS